MEALKTTLQYVICCHIYPCLQNLMSRIDSERAAIMSDIEAGKRLQKERNAPSFIAKNIQDLERKLKDTNELAAAKHSKLKVSRGN